MNQKRIIIDEWGFTIIGPALARHGRIRVKAGNVDQRDRPLVRALAKVIEVWFSSGGRR